MRRVIATGPGIKVLAEPGYIETPQVPVSLGFTRGRYCLDLEPVGAPAWGELLKQACPEFREIPIPRSTKYTLHVSHRTCSRCLVESKIELNDGEAPSLVCAYNGRTFAACPDARRAKCRIGRLLRVLTGLIVLDPGHSQNKPPLGGL